MASISLLLGLYKSDFDDYLDLNLVIDDLHIANHKKESCHEKYNPSRVKDVVPEANLVCAEQVLGFFICVINFRF